MRRLWCGACLVIPVVAFLAWREADASPRPAPDITTVEILDTIAVPGVQRFGLNVGAREWYGAAQYLQNLFDNPGFEAGDFASIVLAAQGSTGSRFVQDFWETAWNNDEYGIGQPAGFWDGAEYEVLSGPAKGSRGTVTGFALENNHNVFYLDPATADPAEWDAMIVRKTWAGSTTASAWTAPAPGVVRPGSPGAQSLQLIDPGNSWDPPFSAYWDSYWRDGDRSAGKLLIVEGTYRLEFWAKGNRNGTHLRARFFREGESVFMDKTFTLTDQWALYSFQHAISAGEDSRRVYVDEEYHPLAGFSFYFPDNEVEDGAWIDDISLRKTDNDNPTVFTDSYVDRLKELRPGVLRDWGNQFGSSLTSQLSDPFGRRTQGFRPAVRIPDSYNYSLPDFLALCREVGAEPWYVIPPTFSPEELAGLVEYLAAPADEGRPYALQRAAAGQTAPWTDVFPIIHLEFGNELWGSASGGDPFMGASVLGGERLGEIANDRFGLLRASPFFDAARFDLIIGGQAGWPYQQHNIEGHSTAHDTIALAPYFGELDQYATDEEIYYPLFARPFDDVASGRMMQSLAEVQAFGQGTGLAVYELNFHTTGGEAPLGTRNDLLTGGGGALALPLHMLVYLREMGIRTQTAFSSLQYSFQMENGEYARLWGLLRDVESTGRKRPAWLGMELANRAVMGDLLATQQGGSNPGWVQAPVNGVSAATEVRYVQSFAFRQASMYSVILFNLHLTDTQRIRLILPVAPTRPATLYQIAPASIHANNEDSQQVSIETRALAGFIDGYELDLPPHSITALTWSTGENLFLPFIINFYSESG